VLKMVRLPPVLPEGFLVDCSWEALLPRVLTTMDPARYMWSPRRFMSGQGIAVIGPAVNRIGMTTGALGVSRVFGFAIELRHRGLDLLDCPQSSRSVTAPPFGRCCLSSHGAAVS
jgi:hypothetical protein